MDRTTTTVIDDSNVITLDTRRRARQQQPLGLRLERMIAETRDQLLTVGDEDGAA